MVAWACDVRLLQSKYNEDKLLILEKLVQLLSEQFDTPSESITAQTDIKEDLGADSLDMVEFIMMLEEEYDIIVTEEAAYAQKTVGDVAKYVESLINSTN